MAELLSTRGQQAVTMETVGYQQMMKELDRLVANLDKKYGYAYTDEVARVLQNEIKKRVRRKTPREKPHVWPVPEWRTVVVKKISQKGLKIYGDKGHRVTTKGIGTQGKLSWLEFGRTSRGGSKSRAFPAILPARAAVQPMIPRIGAAGIQKKLQRDEAAAAKRIARTKDKK